MRPLIVVLGLALALPALAQEEGPPPCTVLHGLDADRPAILWTPGGRVEGGAVAWLDDEIVEVGRADAIGITVERGQVAWRTRTDCTVIDVSGQTVTAGFVAVGTRIGVTEVGLEPETNDYAGGEDPVRAAFRVADAYNPRSTLVPVARIGGITSSVVFPDEGLISGQAAWVDLAGAQQSVAIRRAPAAMVAHLAGPSRSEALLRLREVLDDARFLHEHGRDYDQGDSRPLVASRLDLLALEPVLDGEIPLVVYAERAAEIEALVRLAEEYGLRLVIAGGAEAWLRADDLAAHDVAVIVQPMIYGPGSFEEVHARPENAALLAEAGVKVMLTPSSSHNARLVGQMAGNAVRGGMAWEAALAAVTTTPAQVFGMSEHGGLATGQRANVVVWGSVDGAREVDPFELSSRPTHVFVGGRPVPMQSRQTLLHERYATLPGTPLPPLPLPSSE